jgi:uncharacterized cupin superfamily protein
VTDEARLEQSAYGLVAATEGWFVVNIRDAAWMTNERFGAACIFEGGPVHFPQVGYTLAVLQPGRSSGLYHREANQENFLVLAGECLLLVEGEERRLRAWDFVHCPPGTDHVLVGSGDGPCVVFMAGARERWPDGKGIVYPRSELALRHDAGVERETSVPAEAQARFPRWMPGPPDSFAGLPWA